MCCGGGEGAFLFCTLLLKQIPWAWNIKLFHPKHPCLGTRKNPSCVPYFCHSSQAKHPYFGPQHPSKSRSVTDGVCELVHFQQRGLRGKKNPSRWNFKFFIAILMWIFGGAKLPIGSFAVFDVKFVRADLTKRKFRRKSNS